MMYIDIAATLHDLLVNGIVMVALKKFFRVINANKYKLKETFTYIKNQH